MERVAKRIYLEDLDQKLEVMERKECLMPHQMHYGWHSNSIIERDHG